jgi:hypothetical protein
MLRNPLATSPMLRSARHSSELWVLRPANTGIMAAQHNSNSAIRSRNPTNAHVSRNGGKSRSLRTVCGPIKVLALWLDGPPYRRSRQHYGYMPRCVRQPLPRLRFVGWTARSVETVYPRRHVLYCLWNRLRLGLGLFFGLAAGTATGITMWTPTMQSVSGVHDPIELCSSAG